MINFIKYKVQSTKFKVGSLSTFYSLLSTKATRGNA